MLNSPSFHLYLSGFNCEVTGISIQSPNYGLAPNTDGIDVACDGAYIARNRVVNGDDSLCVKSPGRCASLALCSLATHFPIQT
jgi:polygalacturonase